MHLSTPRRARPRPLAPLAALLLLAAPPLEAQLVRTGTGATAADAAINAVISTFETDLGPARRRIRWDGAPDAVADPNAMPANQFQGAGNLYSIPGSPLGSALLLSADNSNPTATPPDYARIDPSYAGVFAPFSGQRMFTSIGSNVVDVLFVLPGTTTPGATKGFGVVFSDVDLANTTSIELFDFGGGSLGTFFAPNVAGANETFSFLGISYAAPIIGRARITQGNAALAPGVLDGVQGVDVAVTDDFLFAEVAAVPEPSTWMLLGAGLAALGGAARRRRARQATAA